jgi:hypothetical protein
MSMRLFVCSTRLFVLPVILLQIVAQSSAQTELKGLGSVGEVQQVQGGFEFLEGPAKTPDGSIYFTDIPAESIYRMDPSGSIELFLKPSLHANGLMYGGDNRLLACQMDGQLASIDLGTKQITVLTAEYNGQRYNACNDLVVDRTGGVYFTDPRFRAPEPLPQGTEAFYYRSADGQVTRLGSDLKAPNGIALSPDEKHLLRDPVDASSDDGLPRGAAGQDRPRARTLRTRAGGRPQRWRRRWPGHRRAGQSVHHLRHWHPGLLRRR